MHTWKLVPIFETINKEDQRITSELPFWKQLLFFMVSFVQTAEWFLQRKEWKLNTIYYVNTLSYHAIKYQYWV